VLGHTETLGEARREEVSEGEAEGVREVVVEALSVGEKLSVCVAGTLPDMEGVALAVGEAVSEADTEPVTLPLLLLLPLLLGVRETEGEPEGERERLGVPLPVVLAEGVAPPDAVARPEEVEEGEVRPEALRLGVCEGLPVSLPLLRRLAVCEGEALCERLTVIETLALDEEDRLAVREALAQKVAEPH
jgi:hypothetical protein